MGHVINLSLENKIFPQIWKFARILPLLKGKDLDCSNHGSFRPVSQLPLTGKLTERSVKIQLLAHLEQWGLLGQRHHAYRSRTSTTMALLEVTDLIATGVDENMIMGTMSVDQMSAFDCMEHDMLLDKLCFYSLSEDMIQWITFYLNYRSGYIVVGSAESQIQLTSHGVHELFKCLYLLTHLFDTTVLYWNRECFSFPMSIELHKVRTRIQHLSYALDSWKP